jgi:serine/threonine-protein kinase
MGAVHYGRLTGPAGFGRTVAVKRLHANLARDPDLVAMLLSEAKIASRVVHPNVIATLDVVEGAGELFLVMEYVEGESLATLQRETQRPIPPPIAAAIVLPILHGLHAAHETKSERGEPLRIVHRDVSPQNVLVGTDGVARLLDFGVAKAANRLYTTRDGRVKGKLGYVAPEQLRGAAIDRRADVYAAAVVLWEALTGERLFYAENEAAQLDKVLLAPVVAPSERVSGIPGGVDAVVLRGLDRDPTARFATAREMAIALQSAVTPAAPHEVAEWMEIAASDALGARKARVAEIEALPPPPEPAAARPRPTRRFLAAAVAVGAALALAAVLTLRGRRPPPPASIGVAASIQVATAPAAASAPPEPASDPPSSPSPAPETREGKRPIKSSRRADCNPPYVVQGGVHVYKRECL